MVGWGTAFLFAAALYCSGLAIHGSILAAVNGIPSRWVYPAWAVAAGELFLALAWP